MTLGWYVLEALPLPARNAGAEKILTKLVLRLNAGSPAMADYWMAWRADAAPSDVEGGWSRTWAITAHERLRLRCIIDAVVAAMFGLSREDLRWILRDCDHPRARLTDPEVTASLDPKGFWRVGKECEPELRHSVLALVAFDCLNELIAEGGSISAGIEAFSSLNNGDGWLLPETLRLADYDLGQDDRAKEPQGVAQLLGPRFHAWQLDQGIEESWEECARHAAVLELPRPTSEIARAGNPMPGAARPTPRAGETNLLGEAVAVDLFGNPIATTGKKRGR